MVVRSLRTRWEPRDDGTNSAMHQESLNLGICHYVISRLGMYAGHWPGEISAVLTDALTVVNMIG